MRWLNRRRSFAIIVIAAVVLGVFSALLLRQPTPLTTSPKPGGGGGGGNGSGGGSGGGGGQGSGASDTEAPVTSIMIVGHGYSFMRSGMQYYSGNFTVTLNATDDQEVASIHLQDNSTGFAFLKLSQSESGHSSWASTTIYGRGLHMLEYYSTDKAGNSETPHSAVRGIASPSLSDLSDLIKNSAIDNAGIKNALLAKVAAAQGQESRSGAMNSLNALVNQLNALEGKHGLDSATVANMEAMIQAILATPPPPITIVANSFSTGSSETLRTFGPAWLLLFGIVAGLFWRLRFRIENS
ncbi:hypothetical protein J2P12_03965 [Candidatus Bathyarchaeota archaeon]|nr:hypothetical protein [Candidatus Bathyarchaeota archaeon]